MTKTFRGWTTPRPRPSGAAREQADVVVIGSGIGGLSCGALLAKYGLKVIVCESHDIPGGAAHAWVQQGYHFESGPSLYSGMAARGRGANPIAHVLQALGEELDLIEYDDWQVLLPEGTFMTKVGSESFEEVLQQVNPGAISEWKELQKVMKPLAKAATALPPMAMRADPFVAVTALARYAPQLLSTGPAALKLLGPFSNVIEGVIKDPFIRNWLDLLCFLLSGLPANGTIAAEVAFMFAEWYRPGAKLEFPRGGSQGIIKALVRGLNKHGGRLMLRSHVDQVNMTNGRATGVTLSNGTQIAASKAVVSNASMWDTLELLPVHARPQSMTETARETPKNRSFMHLHAGFDATGMPDPGLHHIVVPSWEGGVDAEQSVVLISIASCMDPSLAPPGKHTLHAYLPATEPYELWQGLQRGSAEYEELKAQRGEVLWKAVERIIPDIRERCEVSMIGTPLTHQHFLRRHQGTYGPGIVAGKGTFPAPITPIPGLLCCGDSTFPGIGVPAVAASGAVAANTLASPWAHWKLLDAIGT
ncbi:hypothetical protein WJX73_003386 [Symbiochloris irregularis]|uniref:Amine oxidase domain-containing protein n=1 Tax=Symbiochloris irregularis TaxID=706552 RepID=A0AAW1PPQ8_9CHLO